MGRRNSEAGGSECDEGVTRWTAANEGAAGREGGKGEGDREKRDSSLVATESACAYWRSAAPEAEAWCDEKPGAKREDIRNCQRQSKREIRTLKLGVRDADLLAEADRALRAAEERGAVRVERLVARLGASHRDAVDRLDGRRVLAAAAVPGADKSADTELDKVEAVV